MENQMLCYQCGNTDQGKCCNGTVGTCGKTAETAKLQDEITGALVGLAKASVHKSIDDAVRRLMVDALAATAAHSHFDNEELTALLRQVQAAKTQYVPKFGDHNTSLKLPEDFDIRQIWQKTPDIRSLKSLLLFGLRGLALIVRESEALGYPHKEAASFFHKGLIALGANHFKEDYYSLLGEMGGVCLRSLELLAKARQTVYGDPSATEVNRVIQTGPFIIVSGHDYSVLEQVLTATADTGIGVYSHGEMLSAHGYPKFKQYPHFLGHYGTGQQEQTREFQHIPGAIVFSGDCVALPEGSYQDRCFTAGTAHISGIPHLEKDFTPVLIRSIELGGAPGEVAFPGVNGGEKLLTGYGRKTQCTAAYKLAAALKEGELKHIYVIGGCEGQEEERRYYTELCRNLPPRTAVLTWGCTKFRLNDIDLGEIGGVPRILDLGQCSDIAQVIATLTAIADGAKLRIEELPLTFHFTWHGSRSVAALLALLAADIQKVVLGPSLPPFFTKEVFNTLVKESALSVLNPGGNEAAAEIALEEPIPMEAEIEPEIEGEIDPESEAEAEIAVDMGDALSVELRSEEAGLPDWAVCDDDEDTEADENEAEAIEVQEEAAAEPKIAPEDIDQTPDFAREAEDSDNAEDSEQVEEAEEITAEAVTAPIIKTEESDDKIALPKGKGISGWHDREDGAFDEERAIVSPIKELTEIVSAPLPVLPAGAGVSGFNEGGGSKEIDSPIARVEPDLYSFAEAQAEIVIPKGMGVSGWKESDDISPVAKKDKKEEAAAKPWLAASLKRLRNDEDGEEAPAQKPAKAPTVAEAKQEIAATEEKETPKAAPAVAEKAESRVNTEKAANTAAKPWLAAKLEELHADVEAAAEDAPGKKPVKSGVAKDEEAYVSNYRHDEATAAAKPWLNASIEELHASIDRESGIKTKRKKANIEDDPATAEANAGKWQDTAAKSWLQIGSAAPSQGEQRAISDEINDSKQSSPVPEVVAAPPRSEVADEPSGGEVEVGWTKPPVTPKPWDRDLQTTWEKPAVLPKPWEMQQPTTYHDPTAMAPQQGYVEQQQAIAAQQAYAEQQQAAAAQQAYAEQQQAAAAQHAYEQQQALAAQQAYEQQQAIAAQQAYEQQQAAAAQQAYEQQQQAIAAQQAYEQQQQALAAQQAYEQQQQAIAAQQAYEQQQALAAQQAYAEQQRAIAAQQAYAEQQQAIAQHRQAAAPYNRPAAAPTSGGNRGISGVHYTDEPPVIPVDYSAVYGVPPTPRVNLPQGAGLSGWNDPNPTKVPNAKTFSAGDFFGFRNSEAPAGVSRNQSQVITPGSDDEFITTTGPDGEVILTVRTDKNK